MRITEGKLILPALSIIRNNPLITTEELIVELEHWLRPEGEDRRPLQGRADNKFSQKVRNLKSHNTLEKKGFAEYVDGRWICTEKGHYYVTHSIQSLIANNTKA